MDTTFNALVITEQNGQFTKEIKQLNISQLPDNDLLIRVRYSSVNYKDALSASGNKGVTKAYPHVPGIDAVGEVIHSRSDAFRQGDQVLITGFDLGMNTWGGFGQYISVPSDWALHLPDGLTAYEAMAYGTAGFTAALSVHALIKAGVQPQQGPIAVSGATGGVGSVATAILSKLGYHVMAISGKPDDGFLTKTLGATGVIDRNIFIDKHNSRPITAPAFAGGIDTVAGPILSGMLKATRYGGAVTCCGMVSTGDLDTTIFPFILRNVSLLGIDSVSAPMELRQQIWQFLANEWKPSNLSQLTQQISLEQLPETLDTLLAGQAKGRFVLAHELHS
ncbi:YhdH/YhfP family quinone oxidoreductase [Mucilaginibacter daejeonensis]|uniref:YhdH/YhfP family quinone oxidoreductase n=1 Tax=Mucilaginibacter daejeonensis TaxID=398049 RepID=UPI001D17A73C|nr:YhdH/YhfP family quinone oxidoreductase [Mucilaginibacter daejeonensis]UEG54621.1 YhdH/YhfP family quinone oxidoreductase [Mucilaginibacter daejeonensis]